MLNDKKNKEILKTGSQVTLKWATRIQDEYIYEKGVILASYITSDDLLRYMVRIKNDVKNIPHYQVTYEKN